MSMAEPAYWPDGSLKHRWGKRKGIAKRLCEWCGQTAGPSTIGWACRATFRPDIAPKIEARRAEMRSSSVEDESLVTEGQASSPSPPHPIPAPEPIKGDL